MVVWHNTVLQCGKNGRGQVNIIWHVLRTVYCLLGPNILVTPLDLDSVAHKLQTCLWSRESVLINVVS